MSDLLTAELDLMLRRIATEPEPSAAELLVTKAERFIEHLANGPLRIADVARHVGASPSHLRSQFVAIRGITPVAYAQTVRLRTALGYLRNSTLTLDAVAALSGYHSASHLSRHIRAATGMSPGAVRHRTVRTDLPVVDQ
ncbi:helix-turn-helix transcriptional regulator [Nocardia africana]|uniref:Helix-turn-helix transcriptional regulator n=1 Tax=Nocardia africana TaxID=134964 RepID=A0ABW6NXA3_9NOCA